VIPGRKIVKEFLGKLLLFSWSQSEYMDLLLLRKSFFVDVFLFDWMLWTGMSNCVYVCILSFGVSFPITF
jgi:hypothetical protein